MYHNKEADTDTSAYHRVLYTLLKLDTLYNPTVPNIPDPIISGRYKVTGDIRNIPIVVEDEEEKIAIRQFLRTQ